MLLFNSPLAFHADRRSRSIKRGAWWDNLGLLPAIRVLVVASTLPSRSLSRASFPLQNPVLVPLPKPVLSVISQRTECTECPVQLLPCNCTKRLMGSSRQENFWLQTESLRMCFLSSYIRTCLLCWDGHMLTANHEVKTGVRRPLMGWNCNCCCK